MVAEGGLGIGITRERNACLLAYGIEGVRKKSSLTRYPLEGGNKNNIPEALYREENWCWDLRKVQRGKRFMGKERYPDTVILNEDSKVAIVFKEQIC